MRKVKAAIYQGQKHIDMAELPTPAAGDDDVVIRNLYASICGTDVAVYLHEPKTGHRISVGEEFGHEAVSVVAQAGKDVRDFRVGDIVYPYPLLARGDTRRAGTMGAFSEYILIPHARKNRQLYPVDPAIPTRAACLIEPFTVGCRAARRARPEPGESAVVFGAGTIGIAAAIALREFGLRQVLICDHSDFRLGKAAALGFAVCNNARQDLRKAAIDTFGTAHALDGATGDVDIYIDAAGAPELLDDYFSTGKIESRMVAVAVAAGKRPVDILHMTYAQQALIGSGGYMPEDVSMVMAVMASGRWDVASLITHEYPWEQLPQAIEMAARPQEALNVIVRYDAAGRE